MRRLLLGLLLALTIPAGVPAAAQSAGSPAILSAAAAAAAPRDHYVVSGDVLVAKGETAGDVVVADGDVVVRGTVHGDVVALNGDVTVRGSVTGNVVTVGKRATLGRRARVGGDLTWVKDRPVVAPGAVVDGKVKQVDTGTFGTPGLAVVIGFWLVASISLLVGGLLLLLLAPRAADAVVRAARAGRGAAIISGILLLILLPILAAVLIVTVVGIPLGIGLLLLLGPLYAVAYMASAMVLGRRLVKSGGRGVAFLAGMVVLRLLALIPGLGALISLVATVFGLGALFVAIRRARIA